MASPPLIFLFCSPPTLLSKLPDSFSFFKLYFTVEILILVFREIVVGDRTPIDQKCKMFIKYNLSFVGTTILINNYSETDSILIKSVSIGSA